MTDEEMDQLVKTAFQEAKEFDQRMNQDKKLVEDFYGPGSYPQWQEDIKAMKLPPSEDGKLPEGAIKAQGLGG